MDNLDQHPIELILSGFKEKEMVFCFDKYKIKTKEQTQWECPREKIKISKNILNFDRLINTLQSDQELALTSCVEFKQQNWHIPMVDLALPINDIENIFLNNLQFIDSNSILAKIQKETLIGYYNSGRAGHIYWATLLTKQEWQQFLGELLVISAREKNVSLFADIRWIGHSLRRDYSCLRWTNNSKSYLQIPKLVKYFHY